jgi:hypothetical protein
MRPIPSAAARRFAIAPASRVGSFVPKTVAWQAVRCYASGSSLDKDEVYVRIKQLLSGFDKVRGRFLLPFHHPAYPRLRELPTLHPPTSLLPSQCYPGRLCTP